MPPIRPALHGRDHHLRDPIASPWRTVGSGDVDPIDDEADVDFENGWDVVAGYEALQYRDNGTRVPDIRGVVGGGTPGSRVTTLPDWLPLPTENEIIAGGVINDDDTVGWAVWLLHGLSEADPGGLYLMGAFTDTAGAPGADGAVWRSGSGVPSNSLGVNGDFYLRTSNGDVYEKVSGSYTVVANITGPTGATGPTGPTGATGPTGTPGGGITLDYTFDAVNFADADPGNGQLRFNNATISSVTRFYIDLLDTHGNTVTSILDLLDDSTTLTDRGFLHVFDNTDLSKQAFFEITDATDTPAGYRKLHVAYITSFGTFTNGEVLTVSFVRTGNIGATGATGETGSTGATGPQGADGGLAYTYSTDTANSDPGSGFIKFNSTTLSSINTLRISETDRLSNAIAAFIQTWDDSTSVVRGTLTMVKDGDSTKMLVLQIAGAITDNGAWDSCTVTYVTSSGAFSNNDNVRLFFNRTGDTGASGGSWDGWSDDTSETWTYASATTFTTSGDKTAKYTVGTKLKMTNSTVKYFVVVSSSVASGTTTVTITGGADYTLSNVAISANYHSYVENPQGWPGWFAYSPSLQASVTNPNTGTGATLAGRFMMRGRAVRCEIRIVFGTSPTAGSGTYRVTLPINLPSATARSFGSGFLYDSSAGSGTMCHVWDDNGGGTPGYVVMTPQSNTTAYASNSNPWTWAASDQLNLSFEYEV